MRSTILGVGEWRPETVRSNADWPEATVRRWSERVETKKTDEKREESGVRRDLDLTALTSAPDLAAADRLSMAGFVEDTSDPFLFAQRRHVADDAITASRAGSYAAQSALRDACVAPEDVDVVIAWDAVPDRPGCPGAPKLAELIGASRAHALDVQQACASVISSLELAAALVESGRARHVLLTQTHLAFRVLGFEGQVSANVGDIATAILVGPSERSGILATHAHSDGRFQNAVLLARGRDDESDPPWWKAGGPYFFGTKDRMGAQLMMKETVKMGALTIREACQHGRIEPQRIEVVCAPHPRRWIPGAIAETLGLAPSVAPHTYETTAHVGGCGAVANLIEARRRGMLSPGTLVAMYAQGQGMTRAAALVAWGMR
jgi:3-oxoacyl-[acyl-carrier-protein] synthase-3